MVARIGPGPKELEILVVVAARKASRAASHLSTPGFTENMHRLPLATDRIGLSFRFRETQRRFLAKADPDHDHDHGHELKEAVLRHGCFVLSQRGPLRKAIAMPEPKDPLDPWWILSGVGGLRPPASSSRPATPEKTYQR